METNGMQITIRSIRKPKRFRSAFTTEQIKFLELQFKKFPYINTEHRKEIATALNMQERAVKIWFQNRRMKEKKDSSNKELDYVTNKVEESVKGRLINTCTLPSANEQLSYSLPIVVKPVNTSTTFTRPNSDSIHGTQGRVQTQEVPQNLSMNNIPLDENTKQQIFPTTFLKEASMQRVEILRKQFKKPPTPRKPTDFSIDLSKRLKRSIKEMNNKVNLDRKPKVQRNSELNSSIAKPKTSHEQSAKKSQERPLKQAKVNIPAYHPVMPTVYAHPYISSGSVIWKPVNIVPFVAPGTSQSFGHEKNSCSCNCHGTQPFTVPTNAINPYTQYVITTPSPYQNPNLKF